MKSNDLTSKLTRMDNTKSKGKCNIETYYIIHEIIVSQMISSSKPLRSADIYQNKKLLHYFPDTKISINNESTKKPEYNVQEGQMKSNTVQSLADNNASLDENLKMYERLFSKMFKFFKDKVTPDLYEDFKTALKEEIINFSNGHLPINSEDSHSSLFDLINLARKNSRNNKNSGSLYRENVDNLTIAADKRCDNKNFGKFTIEKNEDMMMNNTNSNLNFNANSNFVSKKDDTLKREEKESNKKLKLSFDFSSKNSKGKLIPNFNIKIDGLNQKSSPKAGSSGILTTVSNKNIPISGPQIKEGNFMNVYMPMPTSKNSVSQAKSSLFNLSKADGLFKFMHLNSNSQSHSKSKSNSRDDSNARSVGLGQLQGSKSKTKLSQHQSSIERIKKETVNLNNNQLKFTTKVRGQAQPLLNGKLFMKLSSNASGNILVKPSQASKTQVKQAEISNILIEDKGACSTTIPQNKINTNPKPHEAKKNSVHNNTAYIYTNIANNTIKLPGNNKKIMDLTYNASNKDRGSSLSREKNNHVKTEFIDLNGKTILESVKIQGEGGIKGGELLKEIQQNLEDNLKGMFNFSYEGFLNKESESEGRCSNMKSPDMSDNDTGRPFDARGGEMFKMIKNPQMGYHNEISYEESEDKLKEMMYKNNNKR